MEYLEKEPYKSLLYVIHHADQRKIYRYGSDVSGIKPKEIRYILQKDYTPQGKHKLKGERGKIVSQIKEELKNEGHIEVDDHDLSPQKEYNKRMKLKDEGLIVSLGKGWRVADVYKAAITLQKIKDIMQRKHLQPFTNMMLFPPDDIDLFPKDKKKLQIIEAIATEMFSNLFWDIRYREAKEEWTNKIIHNSDDLFPVLNLFFWIDRWLFKMVRCGPKWRYAAEEQNVETLWGSYPIDIAVQKWKNRAQEIGEELLQFHIRKKYPDIQEKEEELIFTILYREKQRRWSELTEAFDSLEETTRPKQFLSVLLPSYIYPFHNPDYKRLEYRDITEKEENEIRQLEETEKEERLRITKIMKRGKTEMPLEGSAGAWEWHWTNREGRIKILDELGMLKGNATSPIHLYPKEHRKPILTLAADVGWTDRKALNRDISEYIEIYCPPPLPDDLNELLTWRR